MLLFLRLFTTFDVFLFLSAFCPLLPLPLLAVLFRSRYWFLLCCYFFLLLSRYGLFLCPRLNGVSAFYLLRQYFTSRLFALYPSLLSFPSRTFRPSSLNLLDFCTNPVRSLRIFVLQYGSPFLSSLLKFILFGSLFFFFRFSISLSVLTASPDYL